MSVEDPSPSTLHVVNEYADIRLRVIETGCGRRLEIRDLRGGHAVSVDATSLEAIASLSPEALATLVVAFTEEGDASAAVGPVEDAGDNLR